ncbi:MAG: hypothetical protein SAK29_17325 [Scytonema sp. PMC 1069.18]|nr:hypothetical protein [Scytonema sp. PMC 1069.18]MEC4882192.1 hypothetical protein [Scytonema sp. PMC 1070.18]
MSTYNPEYQDACEFTIPIKLNIPVEIEPTLLIKTPNSVRERLCVYLEPDVYLKPEVSARPPVCLPPSNYQPQLPGKDEEQSKSY